MNPVNTPFALPDSLLRPTLTYAAAILKELGAQAMSARVERIAALMDEDAAHDTATLLNRVANDIAELASNALAPESTSAQNAAVRARLFGVVTSLYEVSSTLLDAYPA